MPDGDTVGDHTIRTLQHVSREPILRWTMLLHDCGKAQTVSYGPDGQAVFPDHAQAGSSRAHQIMRGLKMDRETMDTAAHLIRWHTFFPDMSDAGVRQAVCRIGERHFPQYLAVKKADILAHPEPVRSKRLDALAQIVHIYNGILAREECVSLRGLKLTGRDLIADGMKSGPQVGAVLTALLDEVLLDPAKNEREYLLARSRALRD